MLILVLSKMKFPPKEHDFISETVRLPRCLWIAWRTSHLHHDSQYYSPETRHSPGPTIRDNTLRRRTPVSARSARPADPGRFHCNPPRMGDDPGGFRLWWRQLTGLDTAPTRLMWRKLSRTTTMYQIIVGRTCSVP